LRQNYVAPVAATLAVSYGCLIWARRRSSWRLGVREAGLAAAMTVVWLLPWMIVSYRSSGTFLFPLMKGNFRPGFPMLESIGDRWAQARFLLSNLAHPDPIHTLPLFLLAGAFSLESDERRPMHSMLAGTVLGFYLLIRTFSLSDPPNLARYYYAFVVATAVAVLVGTSSAPKRLRDPMSWGAPAVLALIAAVLQIHEMRGSVLGMYQSELQSLETEIKSQEAFSASTDGGNRDYRRLQSRVPAGAKLLVMADEPYRFDFKRNVIYNFDIPEAVSPHHALPVFEGPEAFADWLMSQSIRYVAFVPPDHSQKLYRRDIWEGHAKGAVQIWRDQAPFYLDALSNFEKLGGSRKHLADVGGMIALDLAAR
jgi:hypothetical protein